MRRVLRRWKSEKALRRLAVLLAAGKPSIADAPEWRAWLDASLAGSERFRSPHRQIPLPLKYRIALKALIGKWLWAEKRGRHGR